MGRVMDNAIRIGHEKSWKEFAKTHSEVLVWRDHDTGIVVDVEPIHPDITGFSIIKNHGVVEYIMYIFEDALVKFPPDY